MTVHITCNMKSWRNYNLREPEDHQMDSRRKGILASGSVLSIPIKKSRLAMMRVTHKLMRTTAWWDFSCLWRIREMNACKIPHCSQASMGHILIGVSQKWNRMVSKDGNEIHQDPRTIRWSRNIMMVRCHMRDENQSPVQFQPDGILIQVGLSRFEGQNEKSAYSLWYWNSVTWEMIFQFI